MRIILQQFPAFLKTHKQLENLCTTQSSMYTFFKSWYIYMVVSPQFKVKFNHGMLLHVEYFDTQNKHAYFDGNRTTTTNATEISVCPLRTPW